MNIFSMLCWMLYLTLFFPWTVDLAWGRQAQGRLLPQDTGDKASPLRLGRLVSSGFAEAYWEAWDSAADAPKEHLRTWEHGVINQAFARLGKNPCGHGAPQPSLLTAGTGLGSSAGVHAPCTDALWSDDTMVSQTVFQATFAPAGIDVFDPQLSVRPALSRWHLVPPTPFSLFADPAMAQHGGSVADLLLMQDMPGVSASGDTEPKALRRDWRGISRDTAFFLGYQTVVIGIIYLLPESVSRWTEEQKQVTFERWWENVQHPVWDQDPWYVNYIGHPYFGATYYVRARERGFGAFGSFWYAAMLSGLYEFGVEALFERPSYQDLIVTPVIGGLLGAFVFEPLRQRIKSKPERQWYDHLALVLTDPLGAANSVFERVLGLKTEIGIRFRPPTLASHEPLNARPTSTLSWQGVPPHRPHGVGIEFIFNGREQSAR
jgi:hypothetical protein